MIAGGRVDRDAFPGQKTGQPVLRPGPLARIVDARQRLQLDGVLLAGEREAEILPVAAAGQGRAADRAAEIKREDPGSGIAPELQRHQRQQNRLAGPRRPDDESVADIADMGREAERRRSLCLGIKERRPAEMVVLCRPRPDSRDRDHVGEIEGRDRRLADIGIKMPRQAAEPGFDRVQRFRDAGEIAALDDLFSSLEPGIGYMPVFVPDSDRRRDMGRADQIGAELLQGFVCVERLVVGVAVEQRRGLVCHHFFQDRRH